MSEELLSSQDEFDVSDAGMEPLKGVRAVITGFNVSEKENGVQHEVTFEVEGVPFALTSRNWFSHSNEKAAAIGRSTLKRIARAAIGETTYTRTNLIGAELLVNVKEDEQGFPQVSGFRPYTNGES